MKPRLLLTLLPITCLVSTLLFAQNPSTPGPFTPPDAAARKQAVGDLKYLPKEDRKLYDPGQSFSAKHKPKGSDWLVQHKEPGQSFDQFLHTRRNLFVHPRQKLYIQPLGVFDDKTNSLLSDLKEYLAIFFQAEVIIQDTVKLKGSGLTTRTNPYSKQTQILSTDVLSLLKKDLPEDAYARIAVTVTDLYPADDWNFVFGQATYHQRVGVFSFARYGEFGTPQFLRRSIQVTSHETGHMFGIKHCIFYQCVMNGSNHLAESDKAPLTLCPVCLRKLHATNKFEVKQRYQAMQKFLTKHKLEQEALWMKQRISEL